MAQHEIKQGGEPSRETGPVTTQRRPIYKDAVLLQLFVIVFLTDQFTKWLVREFIEFRESVPVDGFFRLTHTFNTGSAFGLFRDQNLPLIIVSVVGIGILMLIYRSQPQPGNLLRLSLGLQFGGATGNLLDRVRLGHVTDFVDVGSWPIFNVADASIVTGLALLAWMFLISDGSKSSSAKSSATLKETASESAKGGGPTGTPTNSKGSSTVILERPDVGLKLDDGESNHERPDPKIVESDNGTSNREPGGSSARE